MRLSSRALGIGESATLRVARRAGELRAQGVEVADFGAGEPDFPSPAVAVEAAQRSLADGFTKYTAAAGIPELRAAIAERFRERHGTPWAAGDVVVTAGAKSALFDLALALFEPGQEVILPAPFWVSFPEQIRFAGAEPVMVETHAADGFRVHAEAVIEAMTPATRAVVLNSPCNPTGGVIGAEDLERIAAACAERGVVLIADETYERFVYDGRRFASAAALAAQYPETVVVVGSFSKTYSMTGWRIGFAIGPAPLIQAVVAIQSHSVSNPTSFAMVGALAALREAEGEVEAMIAEYQVRRDLVMERLSRVPGVECVPPGGAFYAFPGVAACYRDGRCGSLALAEYLLESARVAVVPGIAFGSDDHVRISFACSRETLARGLDRMAAALA